MFTIAHLSHLCLYIFYAYIVSLHMLDISCALLIYTWNCLLTLVSNQESHSGTSTLNLEESRGDSPRPFTGNLATLLCYTLCVSLIALVCINSF